MDYLLVNLHAGATLEYLGNPDSVNLVLVNLVLVNTVLLNPDLK